MHWVERAEGLLYEGESVRETVPVGAGVVVVTTHRLLAFTPDREGPDFRQVDRPNVDGAEVRTVGTSSALPCWQCTSGAASACSSSPSPAARTSN